MPVDDFLSDFIPEATQKRPVDVWMFPHDTAAHNEDEFVGLWIPCSFYAHLYYRSVL